MTRFLNQSIRKTPADDADETKYGIVNDALEMLNKTAYNVLILSQEKMVYFQIKEE